MQKNSVTHFIKMAQINLGRSKPENFKGRDFFNGLRLEMFKEVYHACLCKYIMHDVD